jgi:hypothetical protein
MEGWLQHSYEQETQHKHTDAYLCANTGACVAIYSVHLTISSDIMKGCLIIQHCTVDDRDTRDKTKLMC